MMHFSGGIARNEQIFNFTMTLIGIWLPFILAGLGAWHVTGDRSNAGGVVDMLRGGGATGATDEIFVTPQEATAQQQRDSQGRLILAIFQLSPTPVTIGTRNWPSSLEFEARLLANVSTWEKFPQWWNANFKQI